MVNQGIETYFEGLSGTPAEAGVRELNIKEGYHALGVSVEPLPKQGCEHLLLRLTEHRSPVSVEPLPKQGCESGEVTIGEGGEASQWNPCRSRGASPHLECLDIAWGIGTFIHPPANLIVFCGFKEHLRD